MTSPRHGSTVVDNTPGSSVCPPWLLLLDDPEPARVLVVGDPDDASVAWFRSTGSEVETQPSARVGRGGHQVDLLVITDSAVGRGRRAAGPDALGPLWDRCGPGSALVWPATPTARTRQRLARQGFTHLRPLDPTRPRRRASGALVALRRPGSSTDPTDAPPPRWLAELTQDQPWAPGTGGWSLRVPGDYPSQKAVMVTRPRPGATASGLVKVTRHPRFNPRLDNEFDQLRLLADPDGSSGADRPPSHRAPAALAHGRVAGLTVVVEEAIDGRPFLQSSRLDARCTLADDAVRAIGDLRRPGTASGGALAERLHTIHEQFVAAVQPDTDVSQFLAHQIETIAAAELPDVTFHGDLGTWNLMVADGSVRILDWESAEPSGPPLWDLAYFTRSYMVRAGRRRGLGRQRAIGRHLLGTSPLNAVASGWIRGYADRVGLDPTLLEPLFHTCWMHRAVKEQTRLSGDRTGHYGPLCVRLVTDRQAPGLRSLVTP